MHGGCSNSNSIQEKESFLYDSHIRKNKNDKEIEIQFMSRSPALHKHLESFRRVACKKIALNDNELYNAYAMQKHLKSRSPEKQ